MKTISKHKATKKTMSKEYTPPTLIVYGRLTEITLSGSVNKNENHGNPDGNKA